MYLASTPIKQSATNPLIRTSVVFVIIIIIVPNEKKKNSKT